VDLLIPNGFQDIVLSVAAPVTDGAMPGQPSLFLCPSGQVALTSAASPYGPGMAAINPMETVETRPATWSRIKSLF
jgi:hypothetical protein